MLARNHAPHLARCRTKHLRTTLENGHCTRHSDNNRHNDLHQTDTTCRLDRSHTIYFNEEPGDGEDHGEGTLFLTKLQFPLRNNKTQCEPMHGLIVCRLSTIDDRLSTIDFRLSTFDYRLPTIDYRFHPSFLHSFLPSFLPSINPSFLPSFLPSFRAGFEATSSASLPRSLPPHGVL